VREWCFDVAAVIAAGVLGWWLARYVQGYADDA
jgi:hypothetical protein